MIEKSLQKKKWFMAVSLVLVCALQIGVQWYFGKQKTFLMCDELFTYTSSNNAEIQAFDMPLNEWLDKEWYLSQGAAMEGHTFDYSIPYGNQEADVHPPFYYFLIHTLSSLIPGEISFGVGIGLNILFMLGCTVLLYFLTKEIFKSRIIGFVVAALFGLTYGACNMVLFIRMYTMFTFILLAHVYVYLHVLDREYLTWKSYLLLGVTLVSGVLTHYYFILCAFFLAAWYFVKFWMQKRFHEECCFHVSIEICALVCLAVFPAMWKHIFNDYRGEGARENLMVLSGFGGKLKAMLGYLNEQLFGGFLPLLLVAAIILFAIYLLEKRTIPWEEMGKLFPVIFLAGGYFFLVTKIAPYTTDRYLMPIFPLVYLIVLGGIMWLLGKLIKPELAAVGCAVVFLILSIWTLGKRTPEYAYVDFEPHLEKAEEYADTYCVYIDREYNWWEYYHVIQLLKEYKRFFCISYAAITDDIQTGLEALEGEKEVIVYVGDSELDEEITAYIREAVGAERLELIDEYSRWKIYRGILE